MNDTAAELVRDYLLAAADPRVAEVGEKIDAWILAGADPRRLITCFKTKSIERRDAAYRAAAQFAVSAEELRRLAVEYERGPWSGLAILARRGGDDADRSHDCVAGDEPGSFSMVPQGVSPDRVFNFRYDALPAATSDLVAAYGHCISFGPLQLLTPNGPYCPHKS